MASSRLDRRQMRALLKLMRNEGVAEFSWSEGDEHLTVRFAGHAGGVPTLAASPAPGPAAPAAVGGAAAPAGGGAGSTAKPASDHRVIRSPIVGTFYRSPSPDAPAYVAVGDRVRKGQVVCIVEAMKLMNTIESDADGVVAEILIENAQPVQFGQELIRLSPG